MSETIPLPLEIAIKAAGSQSELARRLSAILNEPITQQNISWWLLKCGGKVPAEMARPIEIVVKAAITRYELRPDVFGDKDSAATVFQERRVGVADRRGDQPDRREGTT